MTHFAGPRILDGARLAAGRVTGLRRRSAEVAAALGRPPALVLIAAAGLDGMPRHVMLKQRAADTVDVATRVRAVSPDATTGQVRAHVRAAAEDAGTDAIFVQYPLPAGVVETEVFDAIPEELDIDVLSARSFARFMHGSGDPPATAEAAFLILDAYGIDVAGRSACVVGPPSALASAFRTLLTRRNATLLDPVAAEDPFLRERLAGASLVVTLAGRPRSVDASRLPAGVVVIDGGYFNPGGHGDLDTRSGCDHLDALVPVPGGLGPMTISVLLERTIRNAGHGI